MTAPEPDVDALRAKLKALGYLDAGVDRFVLAPARAGRSFWQIALRASIRIGVLAGLLLGLSGALAVAVRVPSLLTGARDVVVFATMLAVAFGVAVSLSAFLAIVLAARAVRWLGPRTTVARRARPLALAAGALVGAACLAYLTLWWRTTSGSGSAWWVTTAALLVAVVISVLLGQATTTTAEAVMANELPESDVTPRRRLSLRATAAMALAGLAIAAAALAFSPAPEVEGGVPPKLTVVSTGVKLIVIAVDGYDHAIVRSPYNEPSTIDALTIQRAWMPRLGDDPAREWTTIATGQPAERHGVSALEVRRVAGLEGQLPSAGSTWTGPLAAATDLLRLTRPSLNTGFVRREKAFWEVASQAGLRTVSVNWWTSWPASDEDGTVLTERAVLRLQAGGDLAGEIVPESLYARLRSEWPELSKRAEGLARGVLVTVNHMTAADAMLDAPPDSSVPDAVSRVLLEAATIDAQQIVLFEALLSDDLDLATIYLPGLDVLAGKLRALTGATQGTSVLVTGADAIERYHWWLARVTDRLLVPSGERPARGSHERWLPAAPRSWRSWVIGHPGRAAAHGRVVLGSYDPECLGCTAREHGGSVPVGTLLDIAPTILQRLGVPLSEELPGHPLWPPTYSRHALPEEGGAIAQVPSPPKVPTYGRRGVGSLRVQGNDTLDEEMRDRLRSLGYVQ